MLGCDDNYLMVVVLALALSGSNAPELNPQTDFLSPAQATELLSFLLKRPCLP